MDLLVWLAQYLSRNKIADEKGFEFFGNHIRYTGAGATDYAKAVADMLYKIAFNYGAKNGTLQFLPLDQMREHPGGNGLAPDKGRNRVSTDYFDPVKMLTLGADMGLNGVALHPTWAEIHRAMELTEILPLVLKVSGTTNYASNATGRPESDLLYYGVEGIVEAAEELLPMALGFTYYMGSPANPFVMKDWTIVQKAAKRLNLPVVMWAYPRGPEIKKVGQESFSTVFGAVTDGLSIGAHILKINKPKLPTEEEKIYILEKYKDALSGTVAWAEANNDLISWLSICSEVAHLSGVGVILSGGSKGDAFGVVDLVRQAMDGGIDGVINGRNISTTEADTTGAEANNLLSQTEILEETHKVLLDYPRPKRALPSNQSEVNKSKLPKVPDTPVAPEAPVET